jgi:hypothetical protein
MINAYNILVENPEYKRPLGRSWRSWDNINIYIKGTGFKGVDCIHLPQHRDKWRDIVNIRDP